MEKNRTIVTIQTILRGVGNKDFNNSKSIKLVRHADNRNKKQRLVFGKPFKGTLRDLYIRDRKMFMDYQSGQRKGFENYDYLVVFVGEKGTTARFIAVYKINGYKPDPTDEDCVILDLEEVEDFKFMAERIVIDWGGGVAKFYHDFTFDKPVIRIDEGLEDKDGVPKFTSYQDTLLHYDQLKAIFDHKAYFDNEYIREWKTALKNVNCIYLIQDELNGKQYIGSTYNADGIWGRWQTYFQTGGHGNNKEIEAIISSDPTYARHFHWCILETLDINISNHEAIERENLYKSKFMTREFGYNKN